MRVTIAGGGIGGLAAALFLHARGIAARVFEAASEVRELGVGINILPVAVAELERIGLRGALEGAGNACLEWAMFNEFGQRIWAEPRGTAAGHDWPQISIHRGRLQGLLLAAVRERLGAGAVTTGARLVGFDQRGAEVAARFARRDGAVQEEVSDLLIAADGIHSAARAQLYPDEGAPVYAGALMWRGVVRARPFLDGHTMIIAGYPGQKLIAYPITAPDANGMATINWIADLHVERLLNREDWNRQGDKADFLPFFESWRFPWLDVPGLIGTAEPAYEFPMVDRDPLPRWSFGRVTLLGDAAHPMYPIGSNGATQAIRDGAALADALAAEGDPVRALVAYEGVRREPTAAIVRSNRGQGPEIVMRIAHERAPGGFARIEDVIPRAELEEVARRYSQLTWARGQPAG